MMPGISTGGGGFSGSSAATGGTAATGAQTFGGIKFGSMATGIDSRWLIGGIVVIAIMFIAFLMMG